MKKSLEVIVNLILWINITFLLSYYVMTHLEMGFYYGQHGPWGISWFTMLIIGSLIGPFINFYLFYLIFIPKLFIRQKYFLFVVLALVSSFLTGYTFRLTWGGYNEHQMFGVLLFWTIMALFCGITGGAMKGFVLWIEAVYEKRLYEKKHLQSRNALLLLQARLNPHFLFNSLNNIDVLIEESPKIASEYLKKLSDLLRYVIYETKEEEIDLAKEIAQISSYIDLQKIRTSNLNYVSFKLSGELKDQKIAPMIFIPFVENAFKHSKNKSIDHAIDIQFDIQGNSITMICKNYYEPIQPVVENKEGLGTETIKQRLSLLYPKKHELVINQSEHWFTVSLAIHLKNGN
jgi:two-component system, LytTR family, sensor kinase